MNLIQEKSEKWSLEIYPQKKTKLINIRELLQKRDLLKMFIKKDVVTIYKQTILGPFWFFIQPLMTMLIYIVVFGNIANIPTDNIPKPLFYLSGIILWNFFTESLNSTSETFFSNSHIFGKVYFPRLIIPLSKIVSASIKFLIQLLLFILIYIYFFIENDAIKPNQLLFIVPLLFIFLSATGLGLGLIFSSLTIKYRDLKFLIQFGIQLLMYSSPIIYPLSSVEGKLRLIMNYNPFAHIFETFKFAFIGVGEVSINGLFYSFTFSIIILIIGLYLFNKSESSFVDTI